MQRVSAARRMLHVLLATAFLVAGVASPHGSRACPAHAGSDRADPAARHHASGTAGHGSHQSVQHAAPSAPSPSDGPCRCLDDCHSTAVVPLHQDDRTPLARVVGGTTFTAPPGGSSPVRGPRHHLFELHLPNAPPHRV